MYMLVTCVYRIMCTMMNEGGSYVLQVSQQRKTSLLLVIPYLGERKQ